MKRCKVQCLNNSTKEINRVYSWLQMWSETKENAYYVRKILQFDMNFDAHKRVMNLMAYFINICNVIRIIRAFFFSYKCFCKDISSQNKLVFQILSLLPICFWSFVLHYCMVCLYKTLPTNQTSKKYSKSLYYVFLTVAEYLLSTGVNWLYML